MAGLLAWRHAANIQRLVRGTEPKLGAGNQP
jgi:glycerol-3-phosphate acyltransferase PlsY